MIFGLSRSNHINPTNPINLGSDNGSIELLPHKSATQRWLTGVTEVGQQIKN